jgi:hypothetical protein
MQPKVTAIFKPYPVAVAFSETPYSMPDGLTYSHKLVKVKCEVVGT